MLGDGEVPLVVVPGWVSNVDLYDDPSYPFADVVIRRMPTGYAWLKGPRVTAGTSRIITESEG